MLRTIVIGDIHGCYTELMDLLEKVQPSSEDKIISVGDLIVKGPESRKVLDFFRTSENFQVVLGNHEQLILKHYLGFEADLKREHLDVIAELNGDLGEYMGWISQWPHYIDLGGHLVVHAGIRPGRPMTRQTVEDLTELRTLGSANPASRVGTPWFDRYRGKKVVVFGHWVLKSPLVRVNAIGIDTGCVYGGSLTALVLPEARLVSVRARQAYATKPEN